ncbi:MAG TPA: alpha/beta fold hydrolase, partial [Actinomycetota bacterium]|nr:alpha/beta fold hydrolase [Actinomycetota bacterium]
MGISTAPPQGGRLPASLVERVGTLPPRFRREAADGFAADFALAIDGHGFQVEILRGACAVRTPESRFPTASVATDVETWEALDDGALTSIEAFLAGRVAVRGNVEHAVRLQSLFHPAARPRSVRDLEHLTLSADGHTISAYELGEGPTVMLLHGLGASKVSWLPLLSRLAERYRVLVPDLPGHGESSKPRVNYTPPFYAAIATRILDVVGVERAALVGNSMGGRDAALPDLPVPYYARFARILPTEIAAVPLPLRRRLVTNYIRQLFADPSRLPPGAYLAGADEFLRIYRSGRARVALLSSLRGLIRDPERPFWSAARSIAAPTLILWGREDRLVPVRFGRRLAAEMPAAEFRVFDGVGHVPQ